MTVVYLDTLFFLNLGLDGLLLSASKRLAGCEGAWKRTLLAAILGACYAIAVVLTGWAWLEHPMTRLLAAIGMVFLAAERKNTRFRVLGLFFLLSCTLAGGIVLLCRTGTGTFSSGGIPMNGSDGRMLLLCGTGEYLLVSLLCRNRQRGAVQTVPVLLNVDGRTVLLTALVDSGNLLRDPMTGKSVLIAEYEALRPLFPPDCRPESWELERPEEVFQSLSPKWAGTLRLLPYSAVGTPSGLLLAVRLDRMEVNGRTFSGRLAAVTPQRLSGKGSYQAIIGTQEQEVGL